MVESNNSPLVSIGIPVYNGETYIKRALDSLLNQNYTNTEILISDNCSTDNTPTILKTYSKNYDTIKSYRTHEHIAGHANFFRLLELSKGEYFMWAGVDDYWCPNFISSMVNELKMNPQAGVAMSAFERIKPNGTTYDRIFFHGKKNPNKKGYLGMALGLMSPLKYNVFVYGLFRSHLLKAAIDKFLPVPSGDRWFLVQFALAHKFRYVNEVLHIRTMQELSYQDRYPEDDFAKNKRRHSQNTFKLQSINAVYNIISTSKIIPTHRKLYLPIILSSLFYKRFTKGIKKTAIEFIRNNLPEVLIGLAKDIRHTIFYRN